MDCLVLLLTVDTTNVHDEFCHVRLLGRGIPSMSILLGESFELWEQAIPVGISIKRKCGRLFDGCIWILEVTAVGREKKRR